jgi:cell division protein FtsW
MALTTLVGLIILAQPDTGTFLVLALSGVFLFWLSGGKLKHLLLLAVLGVLALFILIKIEPYRMSRWTVFMNPEADQTGAGYQLKQSKIALGAGGIFGRGLGMSIQKFNYLPEPIGDSVFSVFGEEFGFIGTTFLIIAFTFFTYRGLAISRRAPDSFGRLLGSGIVILIITQAFVNIASMTGMIPMTGVPLLFVSKGGSALAITLMQIGVLLNISKHKS